MYALPPPSLPLTTAHLHPSMARGRRPLPQAFRSAVIRALRQVFTHLLSQRRPNSSSRLRSYKLDGPGVVYIVGRVRTTVYNSYIAKQMSRDDFLDALEVKVGHSKNFKARRRAYKRCAGEHTLFWHATYTTRHRMLLESMVHQRLKNIGAALRSVSFLCGRADFREWTTLWRSASGLWERRILSGLAGWIPASSRGQSTIQLWWKPSDLNRKRDSFANGSM
ncbi:hypothetical protein B0H11DRAFT_1920836 [Mycena galericulata]|nr:hypothetical protein B0H11DRAFT_1932076 [Mycena galericulata]KAJ7468825.1 hypothetical protein B0H11DRAFT_1920836 [Mycena galericulata]